MSILPYTKFIKTKDLGALLKFYELKRWDKEKVEILNAISADAFDDAKKHFQLALIYRDMKLLDEAEAEFRAVLIIAPLDMTAHNELGLLYIAKNQYEKAINEFIYVAKNESNPLAPMAKRFIVYLKPKVSP